MYINFLMLETHHQVLTKSQGREKDTKTSIETLTIFHRPLLRLPIAPASTPTPTSLSSTTPPPDLTRLIGDDDDGDGVRGVTAFAWTRVV
ncbi:hypothetical protein HanXRQr2_Chr09g0381431 [Helianthus annuus]|uniref:Uncharacterized protein n=1 Tax=Helianthus annuus TaxID=4232 RepID=A0A9K3I533_HELAN|nr:hypothetical protein HanXRQr2_Chr09g0381431 [Helianthus annuus]KAJ0892577.1 hypothetical protein HanPSC8_Chr09g0367551 [Helianthus annuus]